MSSTPQALHPIDSPLPEEARGAEPPLLSHSAPSGVDRETRVAALSATDPTQDHGATSLTLLTTTDAPRDGNWPRNAGDGEHSNSADGHSLKAKKEPEEGRENGVNRHGNGNRQLASSEMSLKSPRPNTSGESEDGLDGRSRAAEPEGDKVCVTAVQDLYKQSAAVSELKLCSLCDDDDYDDNGTTRTALAEGHCIECDQDLCAACIHRHERMSLAAHHNVVLFSPQRSQSHGNEDGGAGPPADPSSQSPRRSSRTRTIDAVDRCRKHREEKLRFFCKSCQQPVCRDCILTSHKQHTTDDIGDATVAARTELSNMMGQLEQKKHLLESYLNVYEDYRANFQQNAQRVDEMVKSFYDEIKAALDSSYREIAEDLDQCRRDELERIRNQERFVHNNIEDVTKLLGQQASTAIDSSIFVLSQHEVVSHALKTLDRNIQQMQLGQSEFFVWKNPRLTVIPKHFLGRVTFTTNTPPLGPGQKTKPYTLIHEVKLRREMAFNIWEMNSSKSSVRSIVETASGTLWVATPHSLIKVTSTISRDSTNVPEEIAGIAAGPGDKLLVSFGRGSSIKLYAGAGGWSGFASIPKSTAVLASRPHPRDSRLLHMYLAVTSQQGTTKILSYSTDGQVCQQHKLPPEIFSPETSPADSSTDTTNPNDGGGHSSSAAAQPTRSRTSGIGFPLRRHPQGAVPESEARSVARRATPASAATHHHRPSAGLRLSCMAVGADGSLCLGDVAGRRVVMVDWEGRLTGQYRGGPDLDGQGGCLPRSVCVVRPGQVSDLYTHTHTHIYIYIYIYIWGGGFVCVCVCGGGGGVWGGQCVVYARVYVCVCVWVCWCLSDCMPVCECV